MSDSLVPKFQEQRDPKFERSKVDLQKKFENVIGGFNWIANKSKPLKENSASSSSSSWISKLPEVDQMMLSRHVHFQKVCKEILSLMKKYPGLATELANSLDDENGKCILSYFLLSYCGRTTILDLYARIRTTMDPPNTFTGSTLQSNLQLLANNSELLELMAQRCVNQHTRLGFGWTQLRQAFVDGMSMMDTTTEEDRISNVKIFMDLIPEISWWGYGNSSDGKGNIIITNIMDSFGVFRGDYGVGVMEYFFRGLFERGNYQFQTIRILPGVEIERPQAMALSILLPKVTDTLSLEATSWDEQGALLLLDAIGQNSTINKLHIAMDSLEHLLEEEAKPTTNGNDNNNNNNNNNANRNKVADAFYSAFEKNHTLSSLSLRGPPVGTANDADDRGRTNDKSMNLLVRACSSTTIRELKLSRFIISSTSVQQAFMDYLSSSQLSSLSLTGVSMIDNGKASLDCWTFQPTCRLSSLEIVGELDSKTLVNLISSLGDLPRLKHLNLEHRDADTPRSHVNITGPLLKATKGGGVQKLHLDMVTVEVEALEEILILNNQLQELHVRTLNTGTGNNNDDTLSKTDDDRKAEEVNGCKATQACLARVLEHHHKKLTNIHTVSRTRSDCHKELMKIDFYLALNHCGRREAASRDDITKDDFVALLCDVATSPRNNALDQSLERFGGEAKHIMQYGLLRIAPHVWSEL